jgi:hypothetical protein
LMGVVPVCISTPSINSNDDRPLNSLPVSIMQSDMLQKQTASHSTLTHVNVKISQSLPILYKFKPTASDFSGPSNRQSKRVFFSFKDLRFSWFIHWLQTSIQYLNSSTVTLTSLWSFINNIFISPVAILFAVQKQRARYLIESIDWLLVSVSRA